MSSYNNRLSQLIPLHRRSSGDRRGNVYLLRGEQTQALKRRPKQRGLAELWHRWYTRDQPYEEGTEKHRRAARREAGEAKRKVHAKKGQ